MSDNYLYQYLDGLKRGNKLADLPEYIEKNLNEHIVLRDYQKEAFRYFITYYETPELRKNKQIHNLFHMATGSGKTVIMAGLILYLYMQGYRHFLFFVNQKNIIEKTKENFFNTLSSKFLFAENIELMGQQVLVKEVGNFAYTDKEAININFTTTQKLHLDLTFPKENSPTVEDFENNKVVLISDESHHVNTMTKKPTKTQKETINSWEYSVNRIFRSNRDNILLEFTATADLQDSNVKDKYLDKIVYDYTLAKFRKSGYTKDFQNMQGDYGAWERTLLALVLSEYRRHLFGDAGQNIKPVILLKSKTIPESEAFYNEFHEKLNQLDAKEILRFKDTSNELLRHAINYFLKKDPTLYTLVSDLKAGFSQDKSLIINSKSDGEEKEKQLLVNSLEDRDNPYRIIFTVNMLNEGWDVLNLFDIVRLYETRDGKNNKPGTTTISEAQLIGRGARYFPFQVNELQDRFKRKYDNDIANENRILETLLYHSMQDSRYISELRTALKQTGLLPDNHIELEYKLKDNFKNTDFYKTAYVFSNRKVEKSREKVSQIDKKMQHKFYTHKVSTARSYLYDLFGENTNRVSGESYFTQKKIKDIPLNITEGAMANFEIMKFNILKSYFPQLKSKQEFLHSDDYLGNITIQFESPYKKLKAQDLYDGALKVFQDVSIYMQKIETEYEGTQAFYSERLRNVLKDKKVYIENPRGEGLGVSQSDSSEYHVDLLNEPWYAYNDNYGTSEEKAFIKYFQGLVPELKKEYDEIYLVRNERIPALAIYEFDTGERFEPDFILFLQKQGMNGYLQEQIYIEPKGSHLLLKDKWKEDFLLKIEEEGIPYKKYVDDNKYRIIGLPFFNKGLRMKEFEEALNSKRII